MRDRWIAYDSLRPHNPSRSRCASRRPIHRSTSDAPDSRRRSAPKRRPPQDFPCPLRRSIRGTDTPIGSSVYHTLSIFTIFPTPFITKLSAMAFFRSHHRQTSSTNGTPTVHAATTRAHPTRRWHAACILPLRLPPRPPPLGLSAFTGAARYSSTPSRTFHTLRGSPNSSPADAGRRCTVPAHDNASGTVAFTSGRI
jgi:hypothetical protein